MIDPGAEDPRTFEDLMAQLESVTEQLAAGDLGIESAVELYERAWELHALATARLDQVKARVERLGSVGHEGPSGGAGESAGGGDRPV